MYPFSKKKLMNLAVTKIFRIFAAYFKNGGIAQFGAERSRGSVHDDG
jgi:hypothetical protein